MNSCVTSPNDTIGSTNITWTQAFRDDLANVSMTSSYLRPDTGGSLLPWIYTVVLLLVHLPVVIIRVVRWEVIQSWCLVAAFFTVVIYTQAYISTQFDPAKILVWTPIILVIDAGSMLQVFFLVIEAKKVVVGDRIILMDPEDSPQEQQAPALLELEGVTPNVSTSQVSSSLLGKYRALHRSSASEEESTVVIDLGSPRSNTSRPNRALNSPSVGWFRDPATYSALCAALLFIMILILQILGLAKAAQANRASSKPPPASFCSPLFQPFGLAVVDGDCHIYDVNQSAHQGIGCINLPGIWQQQWLKGTVAGTSIELITQVVDLLILIMVNGSKKWRGVKMKRPWATIFSGVLVLVVTLIYGITYATTLPAGVSTRVMVLMDVQGPASYEGTLTSAGLRGTIIGWNDGLFSSWNTTYYGTWLG